MNLAQAPSTTSREQHPRCAFDSDAERPPPPETAAAAHVMVIAEVSSTHEWLRYFLAYDPQVGCWALDEPGYDDTYLINEKASPELNDPADAEAAQRWATAYIDDKDDCVTWPGDTPESDRPAHAHSRVTQWQAVMLNGRVGYVPLFTDTVICQTPFAALSPATGSHCPCWTGTGGRR
jgi:hypothetical protein